MSGPGFEPGLLRDDRGLRLTRKEKLLPIVFAKHSWY